VELRDLDIKHPDAVAVRKTASFFEFSLCLSRACLGKMIVLIYKWLKNAVFFPQAVFDSNEERKKVTDVFCGKKTALFAPFIYKNQHFTKTGSGRT
jgi:hypothetical protein